MKKTASLLLLTLGFIGLATVAQAQQQDGLPSGSGGRGQGGGPRELCRPDAMKFCHDIQPGGGRIKDCLEDHYKELSDACYDAIKNAPPPPQEGSQSSSSRGGNRQGGGGQNQMPPDDNNNGSDQGSDNNGPPRD